MEEINKRLNCGNNIVKSQIISRLVQIIEQRQVDPQFHPEKEIVELKFLKEKCVTTDPSIGELACKGLLYLANKNVLSIKSILADFMAIITTSTCPSNVTYLINNLMLIDVRHELLTNSSYKCEFNLRLPQHPFIIMLNENPNCWKRIYAELVFAYGLNDERFVSYCNAIYKPLYLYVICEPSSNYNIFKRQLWSFLLHIRAYQNIEILPSLLCWLQINSRDSIEITNSLISSLEIYNLQPDLLILWQVSCLYYLILYDKDPREAIHRTVELSKTYDNPEILDCVLIILSKTISICSAVYLGNLLNLTKFVLSREPTNIIIRQMVKATILQWIANPNILIENEVQIAKQIFQFIEESPHNAKHTGRLADFKKENEKILGSNNEVYLAMELCSKINTWKSNECVMKWLEELNDAPADFLLKITDFLFGLFLSEFNDDQIELKIFQLLVKCSEDSKKFCSEFLTIILYKLSTTINSDLHFQLLKTLPKMGIIKENIQKIINTLQALNKAPNSLHTFSVLLMFELWKIDNRCYPQLENLLIQPFNSKCSEWEFYIVRAQILKEICSLKPELYGKDMVAHLSKILNDCNHSNGEIACGLAIEGITYLCKVEIIDAVTTWNTIAPMFKTDSRIHVIKSLCGLISEIPHLSYTEDHPNLIEEVLTTLWNYINSYDVSDIWEAALNALTSFSLEQIKAYMPKEYLDEDSEDKKVEKPNHHWIKLLHNCNSRTLPVAGNFLSKLIGLEVDGYLKYVYQVKSSREPIDYSYLPINSTVRCIGGFVKTNVQKWGKFIGKEMYFECLRILAQEYSKPLPPLDWCFLQELIHVPELKSYCIDIAAHQVILSGTARRLIENYIAALTQNPENETEIIQLYKNLRHIANSIQPITLKPFLTITITVAVDHFNKGNEDFLNQIVKYLIETLKDSNIQDTNKSVIVDIISNLTEEIDTSSKLFSIYLRCIKHFTQQQIDAISSPKKIKEPTGHWLKKAIDIRCYVALNATTSILNWLNDLIEVGSAFEILHSYMFEEFAKVFKKHIRNTECALWLLDFLGQIQALVADKGDRKNILFQCDVLILMVTIMSGHFVFLDKFSNKTTLIRLFPQAIATLLDINHWSICTIMALEWLHFMHGEDVFPLEYTELFKRSLQALRHDHEFQKNMNWMKFMNIEC